MDWLDSPPYSAPSPVTFTSSATVYTCQRHAQLTVHEPSVAVLVAKSGAAYVSTPAPKVLSTHGDIMAVQSDQAGLAHLHNQCSGGVLTDE